MSRSRKRDNIELRDLINDGYDARLELITPALFQVISLRNERIR